VGQELVGEAGAFIEHLDDDVVSVPPRLHEISCDPVRAGSPSQRGRR
jgi:hypothetical protein